MHESTHQLIKNLTQTADHLCYQIQQELDKPEPNCESIARFSSELSNSATLISMLAHQAMFAPVTGPPPKTEI